MSRRFLSATAAMFLLTVPAIADGGPVPEASPPPPPPPEEPDAPPPAPEPDAPPPAHEPAPALWYAALHGGAVWQKDIGIDAFGDIFRTETGTGWAVGGAFGHRYDGGLRTELEAAYRQNEGDLFFIDPVTGPELEAEAEYSVLNFMLNVLYDFETGYFFSPYIGAGIGASHVNLELTEGHASEEDGDWAFAYQFIGGFSVPLPNSAFELFADYRYLSTAGLDFEFDGDVKDHDDYESHTAMGGVRFNF